MNFNYFMPAKIFFGSGKINTLGEIKLPGKKALIVISSGKSMKRTGYLEKVQNLISSNGSEFYVFDKISPNPTLTSITQGAKAARNNGCDYIIGLGGGSSIDAAKSIAVMANNPGNYWDYISGGTGKGKPVPNDPLPLIAITTTAGTGTEADPWTVVTKERTNEKIGFGYEKTFPTISIVDPDLMTTVPPKLTAFQGFDAFFHAAEGFIANISTEISDMFALKSIELIGRSLSKAVRDGDDIDFRTDVALANTLSGFVESTSSCISQHSLEHALSAFHPELPHGAGLILLSEEYFLHFIDACAEKYIRMAQALGKKNADKPEDFIRELIYLQESCGVRDLKMSDFGIDDENLGKYVDNAFDTMGGLFNFDPVKLTKADALEILKRSYK
ncbi:MAG: iron-containing alcohol dehydrogenase [Clostridia bacterium]|nr:iron-containing alcohol dehydrogenase [Clostridia bacterium]MBN2882933.1 iron-containing alcohol dehydrogenase [Clostridia bacterium]